MKFPSTVSFGIAVAVLAGTVVSSGGHANTSLITSSALTALVGQMGPKPSTSGQTGGQTNGSTAGSSSGNGSTSGSKQTGGQNGGGQNGPKILPDNEDPNEKKPKPIPVGPNTPVLNNGSDTVVFDKGPFQGLEPFAYRFFASARVAVDFRRQIQQNPALLGLPEANNALKSFVGPANMAFANVTIPAPDRYQLGPGDGLILRYSSPVLEAVEKKLVVDPTGSITLPVSRKRFSVRGFTLASAEKAVQQSMAGYVKDVEVQLTLDELRTISVSIVGEVVAQGNYQLPSVITAFNALYAAGGPTLNGSLRNIQLRRANGSAVTIDFYRYFLRGDASQDIPLQPGDVILVPVAKNRVAVKGEVTRQAVYELADGEKLLDAVAYAGGALPTAVITQAEIASVRDSEERVIINADLKNPAQNIRLKANDVVTLYPVHDELLNVVRIEGAVNQPRAYEFVKGMTVRDAVSRAQGLLPDAYSERAMLYRKRDDNTEDLIRVDLEKALAGDVSANVTLAPRDRLFILQKSNVTWLRDKTVEVTGAFRSPGIYNRAEGMRIADLVLLAGGLLPNAFAERAFLRRRNPDLSEGELKQVDLGKAMAGDAENNLLLNDRDVITVYTTREAQFVPEQSVRIGGAVLRPGVYPRSLQMSIRDLITLSGGLMPNSGDKVLVSHSRVREETPNEEYSLIDVIKGSTNPLLADGDVVTIPADGEIRLQPITVSIQGRVRRPGVYALTSRTQRISDLVKLAGGLLDDAWSDGAQFMRDPKYLDTEVALRLTPRVREILDAIQKQEYIRALAKSDIDKLRAINSNNSSGLPNIGMTGTITPPVNSSSPVDSKLLQRETVSPARPLSEDEIETSGNVPIRLSNALSNAKSADNVELKDGDILTVPERPTTVILKGAVAAPSAQLFLKNQTLKDYLEKCGGLTSDASRDDILVIRASGTIVRGRMNTRIELGDTIYVPTKVMVARLGDSRSTIDEIVRQVTSAGLLIAIFRSLTR